MSDKPRTAFILAAGKGTRLRPHTDTKPKPMVEIAGKSIIRRTLEKLALEGVEKTIVNLHHLAPALESHLSDITHPRILLSHEMQLLETGGGICHAKDMIGTEPFYIINGDALWDDAVSGTALARLADAWDDTRMDIILLLQPTAKVSASEQVGDYHLDQDGHARRAPDKNGSYMFAGVRIAHPRILDDAPEGAFSFLTLMDRAEREGRLFGIVHDSEWYHISTPEDLADIDALFRRREGL